MGLREGASRRLRRGVDARAIGLKRVDDDASARRSTWRKGAARQYEALAGLVRRCNAGARFETPRHTLIRSDAFDATVGPRIHDRHRWEVRTASRRWRDRLLQDHALATDGEGHGASLAGG